MDYREWKGGRGQQALGSEQDQHPEYLKKMRTQQWLSSTVKRFYVPERDIMHFTDSP